MYHTGEQREAHEVPGAGTAGVGALIARELVDEHALVSEVVERAAAASAGGATSGARAVGLGGVL